MPQASGAQQLCDALTDKELDTYQQHLSYSIPELPGITGISRSVIYTEIRKGHLATFKLGAKRYARHTAVMDWLEKLEAESN